MFITDDGTAPPIGINSPLVSKAALYSRAAHGATGLRRRYSGKPYSTHPDEVFKIMMAYADSVTEYEGAAAYLHDVVEDTAIDINTIILEFGEPVGNLVAELTDPKKSDDYVRSEYKRKIREKYAKASASACKVKLADIASNIMGFPDIPFKERYFSEQRLLAKVIGDRCPELYALVDFLLRSEGY